MARLFDRNMFIMLLAIMIGAIVITFFVADIVNRSKIDTLQSVHDVEIKDIESKNENFTSRFIESSVILDHAREDRAFGNYYFDLAFLWYQSALSEKNVTMFGLYKTWVIDNCTKAMSEYLNSNKNFEKGKECFNTTKNYTSYSKYLQILDLYVNLTDSGSKLTMLRYNAVEYMIYLVEHLEINIVNNTVYVGYSENVSEILDLFNEIMEDLYPEELDNYNDYLTEIDDIALSETIRE